MPSNQTYWAGATGGELAEEVFRRVTAFYRALPSTLAYQRWVKGWAAYCGLPTLENPFDVAVLGFTGAVGEITNMRTDDLGSLARHMCQLVTQSRPALEPVATNSDYASVAQTKAATGILEYVMQHEGLESKLYRLNEIAVCTGMGWISAEWDPSYGPVYMVDPQTGSPLHEGRFTAGVFFPWDVATDLHRTDPEHQWCATRSWMNKWDLVAQYPNMADEILSVKDFATEWNITTTARKAAAGQTQVENDLVNVFTFFHDRTAALPNGKWAVVLDGNTVLAEGPLPYETLPLVRHSAGEMLYTAFGDSPILHGLGIQTALDQVASAVVTNNVNLARQTIAVPKGAEFSNSELSEGMSAIEIDVNADGTMTMPQAINLVKSAPETYQLWKELIANLGRVTGINSIVSGADPGLQKELSGSAMLLLEQQTLRYISGVQVSFTQTLEKVGTRLVQILKRYAKSPKLIRIAGKSNAFAMKEFSGRDFEGFDRVEVQQGNPGMRTPAFRLQIAQDLVGKGLVTSADQYLEVLTTGQLESITDPKTQEQFNIRRENELLMAGQPARVLVLDDHVMHLKLHRTLLDDPDARGNSPEAVAMQNAVLGHMQEHLDLWRTADPGMLQVLGIPPPPPPPMPPGMPGPGPGAPPGPPPGPPHVGPPPGPGAPPPHPPGNTGPMMSPPGAPPGPHPPQMPKNLLTGGRPAPMPGSSGAAPGQ